MDAEIQAKWDKWADERARKMAMKVMREQAPEKIMAPILESVGRVIATELAKLRAEIREKDGASLMRGGFGAVMQSNLQAISQVCDAIELKKAVLLDGEPSSFVRRALK